MTGTRVQLGVADSFHHDLIEADGGNNESRNRGSTRGSRSSLAKINQPRLANGALRLGALPRRARVTPREGASRVGRAGMNEQRAAEEVQQRAQATAHPA